MGGLIGSILLLFFNFLIASSNEIAPISPLIQFPDPNQDFTGGDDEAEKPEIVESVSATNITNFTDAEKLLQALYEENPIPNGMVEWLTVLDATMDVLSCQPLIKDGRCYKSSTCKSSSLLLDWEMIPFVLEICKDPHQIVIDFQSLDLLWLAEISFEPIVMTFKGNKNNGNVAINSESTVTMGSKMFNLDFEVKLLFDGFLRYDCTKPEGDDNLRKRVRYNLMAPDEKYSSSFYDLKIRIEITKKKWFFFGGECVLCEDIVNESGSYGEGPSSCVEEVERNEMKLPRK